MIDLRSDTKTLPTEAMREAMYKAEVGDDMDGEDPTVQQLEARSAEILGKEAGLFVTSGTQGNLVAMMTHTRPGQSVICHEKSHVFIWEAGGLAAIAGLLPRMISSPTGALPVEALAEAMPPDNIHYAPVGLIELENTHNACGGTVIGAEEISSTGEFAHAHGVPLHIDGARIFNAAVALNIPVKELVAAADTVQFCFSKALGAPVGSMLVGSREFIERARRSRKMVGGALRQAGVIAAAALIALETGVEQLATDHINAKMIARTLAQLPGIDIDLATVQTNIIRFNVNRQDISAEHLCMRLKRQEILASASGNGIRLVTHRDVSQDDCKTVCDVLQGILSNAC